MENDVKPPPYTRMAPLHSDPTLLPPEYKGLPYQGIPPPVPVTYQQNMPPPMQYGTTTTTLVAPPHVNNQVIVIGGCPACRIGVLEDDFTCLGIFCAVFFFPIGIICCLAMKQRRCSNCSALFG